MANNIDPEKRRRLGHITSLIATIIEMGSEGAPSGICYMAMQMHGVGIEDYQSYVDGLVSAGLITNKSHVLRATPKAIALMS